MNGSRKKAANAMTKVNLFGLISSGYSLETWQQFDETLRQRQLAGEKRKRRNSFFLCAIFVFWIMWKFYDV